ncbi:hypothetical protein LCGC14_2997590, partial [marine sediment metagenome]
RKLYIARDRKGGEVPIYRRWSDFEILDYEIDRENPPTLVSFHFDHIHPVALGGKDEYSNIRLLCEPCNLERPKPRPSRAVD